MADKVNFGAHIEFFFVATVMLSWCVCSFTRVAACPVDYTAWLCAIQARGNDLIIVSH